MIEKKKKYKLSDFRYQLPKKFIAQKPKQKRDGSKMMVLNREAQTIKHKKFSDITDYFKKNDLLILDGVKYKGKLINYSKSDIRNSESGKISFFIYRLNDTLNISSDRNIKLKINPILEDKIKNFLIFIIY